MHKHEIIEKYAVIRGDLAEAAEGLKQKLVTALHLSGVKVHTVNQRVKSEVSVRSKISRPDKTYDTICQLTDLIGIRVVTYFEDAVEEVARIVEENFDVDFERSIDKRVHVDPSTFGYRSLHYVCKPIADSLGLPFEIQIRTVLQHAWAEIEHDLGYKFPEAVPAAIKRRFSRVAGLLEIADAEFVELRETMATYENRVKDLHPSHSDILDAVLLKSLVDSGLVTTADQKLTKTLGKPLSTPIFFPDYLIRLLNLSGLSNSADIFDLLTRRSSEIASFMKRYFEFTAETWGFEGQDFDSLQRGYSLFLLAHWHALDLALLDTRPITRLEKFYAQLDYPNKPEEAIRVAKLFYQYFSQWTPSED
jgi:putative GTP pyrophosphokinase